MVIHQLVGGVVGIDILAEAGGDASECDESKGSSEQSAKLFLLLFSLRYNMSEESYNRFKDLSAGFSQ